MELRAFNGRGAGPVGRIFCAPNDAGLYQFVEAHRGPDVYVGVASRVDSSSGTLENCQHLGALFIDIDFKATPETDARARLERFPLAPSAVVRTGGGKHVYWFLREPMALGQER